MATKEEFLEFFKVSEDKVTLIHDGYQDLSAYADRATVDEKIKPYFFFAGRVKPRKITNNIVAGFIDFKLRTKADCKLVIAGKSGGEYHDDILRQLRDAAASKMFFSSAMYLKCSYTPIIRTRSRWCTHPSMKASGCLLPRLCTSARQSSRQKSLRCPRSQEMRAYCVDPFDSADIGRALERMYTDENLRTALAAKGEERAKLFSWKKAAREYLALIATL